MKRYIIAELAAFSVFLGCLACDSAMAEEPPELSRDELSSRGRASSVLIELSPTEPRATGFCIHTDGLFVTAGHTMVHPVQRTLVENPRVIVNSGQASQEVLPGKLLFRDKVSDVALVRVEGPKRKFDMLPLGSETAIEE